MDDPLAVGGVEGAGNFRGDAQRFGKGQRAAAQTGGQRFSFQVFHD